MRGEKRAPAVKVSAFSDDAGPPLMRKRMTCTAVAGRFAMTRYDSDTTHEQQHGNFRHDRP